MYPRKLESGSLRAALGSATFPVPVHLENELLVIFIGVDSSTITGAADLTLEDFITGSEDLYTYTHVGLATPIRTTTITTNDNAPRLTYHWYVIEGANLTDQGSYLTATKYDSSATGDPTFPALTVSGDAKSLLLFCAVGGGSTQALPPIGYFNGGLVAPDSNIGSVSFYTHQDVSANVSAIQTINGGAVDRYVYTVIEITSGDGLLEGYCPNTPATAVFAAGHNFSSQGQVDADLAATIGTIDGLTLVDNVTSASLSILNSRASLFDEYYSGGFFCNNLTVSTTYDRDLQIVACPFPDDKDLSGKILSLGVYFAGNRVLDTYDDYCTYFGLYDDTAAAALVWKIKGWDTTPKINTKTLSIIDIDGGYEDSEEGTWPGSSAVSHVILGGRVKSGVYSETYLMYPLYSLDEAIKLVGGNTTRPVSFDTAYRIAQNGGLNTVQRQLDQSTGQYYITQSWSIGDGTNTTVWDSSAQSIEMPSAQDVINGRTQSKIDSGALSGTMDSDCTIKANTWNFGDYHQCILASGTATGLATVVNATPVFTGGSVTGWTFSGCLGYTGTIGTTLTGGNTFTELPSAETAYFTVSTEVEFNKLKNSQFLNAVGASQSAVKITGDQSGTWSTDPNLTVSGNTYDIEYTGTTDFEIQSATSLSVHDGTNGVPGAGTLTIVTPTVNTGLSFTGLVAGSQVVIFETGTQTEIQRNNSTATSESWSEVYSADQDVDYTIMKAGYLPIRVAGVTAGNSVIPISVSQTLDPIYASSHGLAYTTNITYNRTTKVLTLVTREEGRSIYSALIAEFIAQSTLANTQFNLKAIGPDRIDFLDGCTIDDLDHWKGAGMQWENTSDQVIGKWCSIKSAGTIPAGGQGEYQQVDGSTTTDLRATGAVDQIFKFYEDANGDGTPDYDYSTHLVIEYHINGYYESRANVLNGLGLTELESYEYTVGMEPEAMTAATGDPAITLTVVDHTASPKVVGGKSFDYEIQDGGTNTAEDILREWNYNLSQDATYHSKNPFNWPDFVIEEGADYATSVGYVDGQDTTTTLHGCYVSRGGSDHPDFVRFQSNDESYYVEPVTANGSITSLISGSRVRIVRNVGVDNDETINTVVAAAGYSVSYTDGTTYSDGDVLTITIAYQSGLNAKKIQTLTALVSTTGWSAVASQETDSVYENNGIAGSTVTGYSADYVDDADGLNIDIQIAGATFNILNGYAWYVHNLMTEEGIRLFFNVMQAINAGHYEFNTDIATVKLDNVGTQNLLETSNALLTCKDGSDPRRNPPTGGFGISMNVGDIYVANIGGSALTAGEKTSLANIESKSASLTFTKANELDVNAKSMNGAEIVGGSGDTDLFRSINE